MKFLSIIRDFIVFNWLTDLFRHESHEPYTIDDDLEDDLDDDLFY